MKGLVKRYRQSSVNIHDKLRDRLIMDYAPLIKFVSQRIVARLPSNVDIDDLISAGVIGLIDAIEKYDPCRDNKFKTYAEFRIRGAILDELRSQDWVPRSVRDKAKKIERVYNELEQRFGREVSEVEISKKLGMNLKEYYNMIAKVKTIMVFSLDELSNSQNNERKNLLDCIENINSTNPFAYMRNKSIRKILIDQIEKLPKNQRLVLSLYYYENLNLKEIGQILEVTESRVSQLHTQAVLRLRSRAKETLVE